MGKAAKLKNLDKLIPTKLLEQLQKAIGSIKQKGKNAKQSALRTIEYILELFTKGYDEINQFFKKMVDVVVDWFKTNKKDFGYKILDDVDNGNTPLDRFPDGRRRKIGDFTRYTNYAEIKARLLLEKATVKIGTREGKLKYISLDKVNGLDDAIRKGIDGVYEFSNPPPKYIITEVKMNTKNTPTWKPKVSTKPTKRGYKQMDDDWILERLNHELDKVTYRKIITEGYERALVGVSKDRKLIIKTLDKNAKVIKDNIKLTQ